jgi:hypothetical protein
MASNLAAAGITGVERIAHYRELAAQFRQWAENETSGGARAGLIDMARQYERLAVELGVRRAPKGG